MDPCRYPRQILTFINGSYLGLSIYYIYDLERKIVEKQFEREIKYKHRDMIPKKKYNIYKWSVLEESLRSNENTTQCKHTLNP